MKVKGQPFPYRISVRPQIARHFAFSLVILAVICLVWAVFSLARFNLGSALLFGIPFLILCLLCCAGLFWLYRADRVHQQLIKEERMETKPSKEENEKRRRVKEGMQNIHTGVALIIGSIFIVVLVCRLWWCTASDFSAMTEMANYSVFIVFLVMLYSAFPIPLYLSIILGVLASIGYELSFYTFIFIRRGKQSPASSAVNLTTAVPAPSPSGSETTTTTPAEDIPYAVSAQFVIARILLQIALHCLGFWLHVLRQIRLRTIFWKLGQSLMIQQEMFAERQLKENLVYSLMPPDVAKEIIKEREDHKDSSAGEEQPMAGNRRGSGGGSGGKIVFRPFNVNQKENVSILFADIVGFTKMSSGKTANELVMLLNDLFGRFDKVCDAEGCEKVATLGDCYYAISGCPRERPDHAECCCELGLRMIEVIEQFDRDHNEQVNMRVGVHTGSVLMGIVGTKRLKFDVWSNDVSLANEMESSGKPGTVHISLDTYNLVKDIYECCKGDDVEDTRKERTLHEHYDKEQSKFVVSQHETQDMIQTFFIVRRKTAPRYAKEGVAKLHHVGTRPHLKTAEESFPLLVEGDQFHEQTSSALLNRRAEQRKMSATETTGGQPTADGNTDGHDIELLGVSWDNMREKADRELVLLLEKLRSSSGNPSQDGKSPMDGGSGGRKDSLFDESDGSISFAQTPVSPVTLSFRNTAEEKKYRGSDADFLGTNSGNVGADDLANFSQSKPNSLADYTLALIFFITVGVSLLLTIPLKIWWLVTFLVLAILVAIPLILYALEILDKRKLNCITSVMNNWYCRNVLSLILVSIPLVCVLMNYCLTKREPEDFLILQYAFLVSVLHYLSFTQASYWLKGLVCTALGLCYALFWVLDVGGYDGGRPAVFGNGTVANDENVGWLSVGELYWVLMWRWRAEVLVATILLVVVVWLRARESELGLRFSFHQAYTGIRNRDHMEKEKAHADWLLSQIVPEHVRHHYTAADEQKKSFSEDHKDVAVIFASISNFNQFYEQSYEGGKGYLRVLNEIFSDFESLLDQPKYKDVDKVKTIGACFMASSGLNEVSRRENTDKDEHLYQLMDFSMELIKVMKQFNDAMFNFKFDLKIGYNFGEVTSGVVGTTKLHYDIWGDTVNVSSRMYSTGVVNRIQVPETVYQRLNHHYQMEYRGKTNVKGKGDMNTYLVVDKTK